MTTVAVLMGGWSPEREVSLVSGKACAEGLRDGGHTVIEYDVKRDLRALIDFLRPAKGGGPDVVFNALHGRYGEDGCIQGVLEVLAVPYTHSGVLASAIAIGFSAPLPSRAEGAGVPRDAWSAHRAGAGRGADRPSPRARAPAERRQADALPWSSVLRRAARDGDVLPRLSREMA